MNKIGTLELLEEDLNYNSVLNHFANNSNVLKISVNNHIDFSIVTNFIKIAENKPNLYGILIKIPNGKKWDLKYIGQRKSKYIRDRLRQHLVKHHPKTGAQLKKVLIELEKGMEIGIILFAVKPDELRQYYEQKLIVNSKAELWNYQRGKIK